MTHLASRIIEHYERHATAWDCDRQNSAWNDKVWHDLFIDRLAAGAKVLDLGCGSGQPVARHMAERGLLVTGVDSSPADDIAFAAAVCPIMRGSWPTCGSCR